jgi:acyl-[acyl-carrier-protein] desaturase
MITNRARKDKMYRAYMEFFEIAERKRRWNIWDDVPWEKLDPRFNNEADAVRIESYCGVELYVPDYTASGLLHARDIFGEAWFAANWGYEESKHALIYREYLIRSGLRTEEQYLEYEQQILSKTWINPASSMRQIAMYGALQELATYHIYHQQYQKAAREGNEVLKQVLHLVARDEAAHCGFYRNVVAFDLEDDPEGAMIDLAQVVSKFQMPGAALIPDYEQRVLVEGVGLTREQFMQSALFPTLKRFGVSRSDIVRVNRRQRELQAANGDDIETDVAAESVAAE